MTKRTTEVRFAVPADLAACSLYDYRGVAEYVIQHALQHRAVILAECEKDVVGYLRLEYLWSKLPYIALVWVREGDRRQGVGRSMLQFLEEELRRNGHKLLLSSSQVNEPSPQAWHRAVGFKECGALSGINEGGIGEVFFRKELDGQ